MTQKYNPRPESTQDRISGEHHRYADNEDCAEACRRILGENHPLVDYFLKHF